MHHRWVEDIGQNVAKRLSAHDMQVSYDSFVSHSKIAKNCKGDMA